MPPKSGSVSRRSGFLALLAFLFLCAIFRCAGRPAVGERHDDSWLLTEAEATFSSLSKAGATWGMAVRDLETGKAVLQKRASQLFIPASNIKLVTTACALELLGPHRVFRTVLSVGGPPNPAAADTTAYSDLVITGGGDPTFGSPEFPGDTGSVFDAWIDSLVQMGSTRIFGDVYGCSGPFPNQLPGRSWEWDNLAFHYAATPSGLCWHDNQIDITVAPGRGVGDRAEMLIAQEVKGLHLVSEVMTSSPEAERDLHLRRLPGTWDMLLTGSLPMEKGPVHLSIAHFNPPFYAAEAFRNRLLDRGVRVVGEARVECPDRAGTTVIATHDSPPLAEIVVVTNKQTKNLWADQLLIMLGLDVMGRASREDGIAAVRKCISDLGLSDTGFRMVDGSGLSRLNLASPDFMTLLLVHSQGRSWYTDFTASLPVAGRDGTLEERMKGSIAEGRIKAKTGSMSSVRALSGIAETLSGRILAFSIMVNGYPGSGRAIDNTIDRVCELLTCYGSRLPTSGPEIPNRLLNSTGAGMNSPHFTDLLL